MFYSKVCWGLYFFYSLSLLIIDSVPHHRLLIKLKGFGIPDYILDILEDFLVGRSMRVKVGDVFSTIKFILSGVPQGSVLGPLLFLLFVNDLPEGIRSILKLFADDVKMIVDPNNFSNISLDLELLELWEAQWCLKFNVQKCMVMQIGLSNPKNQYSFGGESLRCVDNEKDLGVTFNSSFSFEDHVRNSLGVSPCIVLVKSPSYMSPPPSYMSPPLCCKYYIIYLCQLCTVLCDHTSHLVPHCM